MSERELKVQSEVILLQISSLSLRDYPDSPIKCFFFPFPFYSAPSTKPTPTPPCKPSPSTLSTAAPTITVRPPAAGPGGHAPHKGPAKQRGHRVSKAETEDKDYLAHGTGIPR